MKWHHTFNADVAATGRACKFVIPHLLLVQPTRCPKTPYLTRPRHMHPKYLLIIYTRRISSMDDPALVTEQGYWAHSLLQTLSLPGLSRMCQIEFKLCVVPFWLTSTWEYHWARHVFQDRLGYQLSQSIWCFVSLQVRQPNPESGLPAAQLQQVWPKGLSGHALHIWHALSLGPPLSNVQRK